MNNYISTTKDLINLVKNISKETFVAIDTEFIRDKYYYPKLCLIQISSQKESYIIDPLSKEIKLDIFWSIIYNNKITTSSLVRKRIGWKKSSRRRKIR